MTPPELSRPVTLDRVPESIMIQATPEERAALAIRLAIPAVETLSCRFDCTTRGAIVTANGTLLADIVQSCVVSLEPVAQRIEERFTIRFVPEGRESDSDDPDDPDEIPYQGNTIDLGEAVTEQLALALDPYPRRPDAELDPAATDTPSAFAGLSALRSRN